MKDRQFMTMLGLVVAAGLVMGLIAFRVSGGGPSGVAAAAAAVKPIGGDPNAPHPSSADTAVDSDSGASSLPPSPAVGSENGEPSPTADLPEMQGPGSGDPPSAKVDPSAPPSDVSVPPPGDGSPQ